MELSNSYGHSPIQWSGGSGYGSRSERRRWSPIDWFFVILLTVSSALMSFTDLGDRTAPQTFWKPGASGEGFIVDFGHVQPVDRLNLYEGPGARGKTKIEWSADGQKWELYTDVEHKTNRVFTWKSVDKPVQARYIRFTTQSTGYRLYEAAFFNKGIQHETIANEGSRRAPIPIQAVRENGKASAAAEGSGRQVFDEQSLAPYRPDYRNSMYFDEIYHGRTAYEFVERMEPYENTHPPLGKVLLEIGVKLFGMNAYGWRFMAAVFGTLMIPVMYAVARGMFGRTRYAVIATLLLLFEGFHLVHSRMANVDIFGVTFTMVMYYAMYRYGETAWRYGSFRRGIGWLALSGIAFGCAAAVKWNYLYGGVGLAILFFLALWRHYRGARSEREPGRLRRLTLTLLAAVLFFTIVPVSIYAASYVPFERATQVQDDWRDLWKYQINMYNYHKGVKEPHPYASKWYTWPLMLRPVWYYGGADLARGEAQSIAAIGNPLIWWGGLLAMLASWWIGWRRRDRVILTIAVMYLAFYVPWMVAPRSITFLYHYFPMVPLLILSLVWMLRWWEQGAYRRRRFTTAVCITAAGLMVWFYPVLTGITISREWMNMAMRWLPSWGF